MTGLAFMLLVTGPAMAGPDMEALIRAMQAEQEAQAPVEPEPPAEEPPVEEPESDGGSEEPEPEPEPDEADAAG